MVITKKDREALFNKFDGKCAYCGCELKKGWHVDHFEPIWRGKRDVLDKNGKRIWDSEKHEYKSESFMYHPQNHNAENYMPACASCNILKGGNNLEAFRSIIANFINSLNSYTNQYKFAKRYGLVEETNKPVVFYFEALNK